MAITAPIRESDWNTPATKGDVLELRVALGGQIKGVEGQIKGIGGQTMDVPVEMAQIGRSFSDEIATLHVELSSEFASVREELARLRVFMVWMSVGVVAALGGLITLFEFTS